MQSPDQSWVDETRVKGAMFRAVSWKGGQRGTCGHSFNFTLSTVGVEAGVSGPMDPTLA